MSESNLPPERWRALFDKAGIEFGYRPLATRAGLTHTRVHRLVRGGGTTDDAIRKVAKALNVNESKVRALRGEPPVEIEPFTLPDDAGRLNDNERNVIRSMVRALLDARGTHAVSTDTTETPESDAQKTGDQDEEGDDGSDRKPSPDEPKPPLPRLRGHRARLDKLKDGNHGAEDAG